MASLSAVGKAASTAWRRSREAFNRMAGHARPPFKRKLIFEALEQRVLLSADFNPVAPAGSMVNLFTQPGQFANPNEAVSYTLSLDAGQKVSVAFITQDADLQARIRLIDSDGATLLGEASAAGPGEMVLLDSLVAANAGDTAS